MIKIRSLRSIEAEMRAVARGEKEAPADAAAPSFESIDVLIRLLTPENRTLLKTIRDARPQSIAELERLSGRKGPNLLRTLAKLEAIGLVRLHTEKRRTVPTVSVGKLRIEIDPYAMNDRVEVG
jgi:predicted transcriptional regulator